MQQVQIKADQLEFSSEELLADNDYEEPLFGAGVRCHGGYVDGDYVSPRGLIRRPAIERWAAQVKENGGALIQIPDSYIPPYYPNYQQAKLLLLEGVVAPISRSLTIISIVEGFGARIREVQVPDLSKEIKEDISGTALAHLRKGLFEAHARDEAGHRDRGGHKQMWEAARDIGLDKPEIPADVLLRMMSGGGRRERKRLFPDLSAQLEEMITFMASILVIETFAEDVFDWAVKLLGDPEVSADPVKAARMVECIRADEKPHVDYLTVALCEMRQRTLISEDGKKEFRGEDVIDKIFSRQLRGAATSRPRDNRASLQKEIHELIGDKKSARHIARKFESLDSGWTFPKAEDEELDIVNPAS